MRHRDGAVELHAHAVPQHHFNPAAACASPARLGRGWATSRPPLAVPQFRRLWLSSCASNLFRWMELTITSWIALQLTGSPWLVALAGVCRAAPLPLVGPFSGMLADRYNRASMVRLGLWGQLAPLALPTRAPSWPATAPTGKSWSCQSASA